MMALGWSVLTTLVSVVLFGWFLLLGGVLSVVHAFLQRRWGGFFLELFAGILYAVFGLMVVGNPAASAFALTLLIAVFLMIGGIFRIITALTVRFHHWIWVLLNGVVSLLLGLIIWSQLPLSALWVIGLFIGIDMIFYIDSSRFPKVAHFLASRNTRLLTSARSIPGHRFIKHCWNIPDCRERSVQWLAVSGLDEQAGHARDCGSADEVIGRCQNVPGQTD
jgi:uncharacterized membrane protein HdeD (DUF308 family)